MVGYAGLPALIALSVGLASVPGKSVPFGVMVSKRAKRLLLPWVFWCVVYALWRVVSTMVLKKPFGEAFQGWMLAVGPAIHLWYLPFAFVATCLAHLLSGRRSSPRLAVSAFWTACAVIVFLTCSWWLAGHELPRPWLQWTFGLSAVIIGLALPQMADPRRKCIGAMVLAILISLAGIAAWSMGWRGLAVPYLVGTVGLAVAWLLPMPAGPYVAWLGSLSYGIYLVHPLVASLLRWATGTHSGTHLAIVVVVSSTAFVALARRGPLRVVM